MACGCKKKTSFKYLWVPTGESAESDNTVLYDSEIQAKAKMIRQGGSYIPMTPGPDGTYTARL